MVAQENVKLIALADAYLAVVAVVHLAMVTVMMAVTHAMDVVQTVMEDAKLRVWLDVAQDVERLAIIVVTVLVMAHVAEVVNSNVLVVAVDVTAPVLQPAPIIVAAHAIQAVQDIATQLVPMPAKEPVQAVVKTSAQEDVKMRVLGVLLARAHVTQTAVEDAILAVMLLATAVAHLIVRQRVLLIVLVAALPQL